ncbi:MAG: serine/threonine protein kinase [Polyangiaceae bacterium]|nr:serine/threonine protein kinase [Polyangiaceae bacterium]
MPSQPDDLAATLVGGRYRILSQLGRGGMGTVYLAEHEAIHKRVALKVLHPEYSAKPDLVERFKREAISASRIKHPNVLDVFDFGQLDNGCFYLAMEYLEGRDLADDLEQHGVLATERALRITLQMCKALATAHARGVVHRDLKPENVFLHTTADGEEIVKIVDFGIAQLRTTEEAAESETRQRRLTRTGMIFGTPEYMSPEQGRGAHTDHRVDIYATGVMLFEMLTGSVPFTGETFFGVLQAHLNEPIPSPKRLAPQLSPELDGLVRSLLEKDPERRPQSMSELAQALASTPEGAQLRGSSHSILPPPAPTAVAAPPAPRAHGPTGVQFGRASSDAVADTQPEAHVAASSRAVTTLERSPPAGETAIALRPRHRGVYVVAALGLAAAATAAALVLKPGSSLSPSASGEPPVIDAAPPPLVAPDPVVAPGPSAAAPKIALEVVTEPAGATLYKNGAQVCDKTPCTVVVDPHEALELEAQLGKSSGKKKVLAQRDQTVEIALSAPKAAAKPARECVAEVVRDGIKVFEPVPCR